MVRTRPPPGAAGGVRNSISSQHSPASRARCRQWSFMARKIKDFPQQEVMPEKMSETPLLDLSGAAVRALIRSGEKHGYVTHDRINSLLLSEQVRSEQIEDILAKLSAMGVNVVDSHEADSKEDVTADNEPEQEPEPEQEEETAAGSEI